MTAAMSTYTHWEWSFSTGGGGEGQLLTYQIFVARTFCCNLNIVQYCTFNMSYAGEELLVLGLKLGKMVLKETLLGFIHNLHWYWWALIKQKGHPLDVQQSTISVSPFGWQAHSDARSNQKKWGTRPSKLEEPAEWLAPTVGRSPFSQLQLHQMLLLWPTLYQTLLGSTSSCEIQKTYQTPHISWCLILCKDWYNTQLATSLTYFAFDSKGLAEQLTWLALQ